MPSIRMVRIQKRNGDFLSGPVVKTQPSNAGGWGLIPSPGTKIPYVLGCVQKLK